VVTPVKPFVHFPWVEEIAQRAAEVGESPETFRVSRRNKFRQCKFVDDMAEEAAGGSEDLE
jgi:hypothetical protein